MLALTARMRQVEVLAARVGLASQAYLMVETVVAGVVVYSLQLLAELESWSFRILRRNLWQHSK
jgi:hypothetical protein